MRPLLVLALLAGCSSFEDPAIVLDLRVLAMTATVPEQIVDVALDQPPQPSELLGQLGSSEVCAVIADPGLDRRLRYAYTLCVYDDGGRCAPDLRVPLGAGVLEDPETAAIPQRACAAIAPNGNLLGILLATLEDDTLRGLGGIDYLVQLTVGGETADPARDLYAAKTLRIAARFPPERQPNVNPTLDRVEIEIKGEGEGVAVELPLGRCADQPAPFEVRPGQTVRLTPIETAGAREEYVVPTIDGSTARFTESLTYQWIATAGSYTGGSTGGPRDVSGNPAPLFTDWRAPRAADLDGPLDVTLWIIQRDERLGVQPYLSCLRVVP